MRVVLVAKSKSGSSTQNYTEQSKKLARIRNKLPICVSKGKCSGHRLVRSSTRRAAKALTVVKRARMAIRKRTRVTGRYREGTRKRRYSTIAEAIVSNFHNHWRTGRKSQRSYKLQQLAYIRISHWKNTSCNRSKKKKTLFSAQDFKTEGITYSSKASTA